MEATDVPRGSEEAPAAPRGTLDSYFKLTERGTTIGTELRAGLTTFMVMVYIVFLNPSILAATGLDPAAVAAGTALVAGVLSVAMGLVANYPIALAAGLGINGAVAFGLVLGSGLSPAGAMGVIVLEGVIVTLLVLVGLREAVMNAVPLALKRSIGVGIGLFILFIGLVDAGLIVNNPDAAGPVPVQFIFPNTPALGVFLFGLLVTFVYPTTPAHFVFFLGLLITVALYVRRVPAALVISIVLTSAVAYVVGLTAIPEGGLAVTPDFSTIGQLDFGNVFDHPRPRRRRSRCSSCSS